MEKQMMLLEHDAYSFWDWSMGARKDLQDAFNEAGGRTERIEFHEIVVRGLSLSEAMKIADAYQADYFGVVESDRSVDPAQLKIVGSNAPATENLPTVKP